MQLGRPLPLVLDANRERAGEPLGRINDLLCTFASDDSLRRRMSHLKSTARDVRDGDNLEIRLRHECADFQLALANDAQGGRFHSAHADDPSRAFPQHDRRGAGKRQIVDLVGLPARDRGGVEVGVFGVWLCPIEGVADRLRVLRGAKYAHHLTAIVIVLQNLLTDELPFAVAIGGEPNPLGAAQRLPNGLELGGFVSAFRWASVVEALGPQQDRGPPLPGRHGLLGLHEVQEVPFGRQNVAISGAHGGTHVLRLARFLGDDDLIGHIGSAWEGIRIENI